MVDVTYNRGTVTELTTRNDIGIATECLQQCTDAGNANIFCCNLLNIFCCTSLNIFHRTFLNIFCVRGQLSLRDPQQ